MIGEVTEPLQRLVAIGSDFPVLQRFLLITFLLMLLQFCIIYSFIISLYLSVLDLSSYYIPLLYLDYDIVVKNLHFSQVLKTSDVLFSLLSNYVALTTVLFDKCLLIIFNVLRIYPSKNHLQNERESLAQMMIAWHVQQFFGRLYAISKRNYYEILLDLVHLIISLRFGQIMVSFP